MTTRHSVCCSWCQVFAQQPPPWTSLQLHYAAAAAVSLTWLEHGNTMNQRLNVQRPSVLTGRLSHDAEGQKDLTPPIRNITINVIECWRHTRQFPTEMNIADLVWSHPTPPHPTAVEQSVSHVSQCSFPPVYSYKSIACFPTQRKVLLLGLWGSKLPQCSVKIFSCTFAFSTHVWFSTLFFLVHKDQ